MHERMLNKQITPSVGEMTDYCKESGALFTELNAWLTDTFQTEQKVVFPYGNSYGWGIAHRIKSKLICNVFAEDGSFTVMVRLSDTAFEQIYDKLNQYSKELIDNKYPCGDGGWIQYRVTSREQLYEIQSILAAKCTKP